MRIVQGRHANRTLTSPGARVRPTTEEVRCVWMERLREELGGARVVDLFAGSGALGLEALSRGARSVDFVENGAEALHSLKANVAAVREKKRTRIFKRDAVAFAQGLSEGSYDLAFVDAPYGSRKLDRILEAWDRCRFAAVLGIEHEFSHPLPCLHLRRDTRRSGDTCVTLFRAETASG